MSRNYPDPVTASFPRAPRQIKTASGTVRIRTYEAGNEEDLIDMYDTFDPADRAQGIPPIDPDRIREWLGLILGDGIDLIAVIGERVVGHATLVPDDAEAYELAIFVHQDHRGEGIGSALLRTLLGEAVAAGIERIWLTVERWNTVAINLYESVGFERTDGGSFELEMAIALDGQTENTGCVA